MTAETPQHLIELLTDALNRGDVDAAVALYEPEASFALQPGVEVTGLDAIRAALDGFAALEPRMQGEITKVLRAGDVALVMNRWELDGTSADGSPVQLRGHSADVLRRGSDGAWRVLIDDPWGGSA